ncbi:unnamed protein product, partial [Notodromas monacha]
LGIRQLQCILLKISLLVGIEVHENVAFVDLIEPPADQTNERIGWRASVIPSDDPVSQYEFDVLVGADGKRNTLQGQLNKHFCFRSSFIPGAEKKNAMKNHQPRKP